MSIDTLKTGTTYRSARYHHVDRILKNLIERGGVDHLQTEHGIHSSTVWS